MVYREDKCSCEAILREVEDTGFEAELQSNTSLQPPSVEVRNAGFGYIRGLYAVWCCEAGFKAGASSWCRSDCLMLRAAVRISFKYNRVLGSSLFMVEWKSQ